MQRPGAPRILFLLQDLEIGGAQTCVAHLARELAALGCAPLVCAWRRGGPLQAQLAAHSIPVAVLDTGPRLRDRVGVVGAIGRLARAHRSQLVHAHLSDAALWGALLQRLSGIPCVLTHHGPDLVEGIGAQRPFEGALRAALLALCARACAHDVAVSEEVAARVRRAARIGPQRLSVIPNGVPLPDGERLERARDARSERLAAGFPDAGPELLCVSRLVAEKNPDTLLEAAPAILAAHPHARITWLGDGRERRRLVARAAQLGLSERLRFEGSVADVERWLVRADLLVAPSRAEGSPFALIEAMAWGVPVLASDAVGHRELLGDAECGALFRAGNPRDLAAQLAHALRQPAATTLRAKLALERVRERHTSGAMARRHLALYERVVAGC